MQQVELEEEIVEGLMCVYCWHRFTSQEVIHLNEWYYYCIPCERERLNRWREAYEYRRKEIKDNPVVTSFMK